MVEFALIFPIALILLLAVFDMGRAVFIYNGLANASREGARLAIVNQEPTSVEKRVQDTAWGASISNIGDPANPVVAFYREEPDLNDPTQNAVCPPPIVTGCVAVVTARVDWSAITPIIGSIIGPIPLTARSELPVELTCPNPKYPSYATSDLCPKQP